MLRDPFGFTLLETSVVMAIVGFVIVLALPNFVTIRHQAVAKACARNLSLIQQAKERYALDSGQPGTVVPVAGDLNRYFKAGIRKARCPFDPARSFHTSYRVNAVNVPPACRKNPERHRL
ncbi:MAG: type II secretion system protein [Candidatus Omnitrophica bacterium]|nr:type II secretion system protein [Candidatus Omnitrophota bacterium]